MQYYLIETDERNRIPYKINKNRAVDIRMLSKEKIYKVPKWNVMEMDFPRDGFFPDMLCDPCILVSRCFMETLMMYQGEIPYRIVKVWERESGINETYFIPILEEVDCISFQTQYNRTGNRITKLVLEKEKIKAYAAFRMKNYDRNCVVGRMDFVESLLRREVGGIKLTELEQVKETREERGSYERISN